MPTTEAEVIDVAVGVVLDKQGRVLIAHRQKHQHLAGYWEFPGGKTEQNETLHHALSRELSEELGISVTQAQPWQIIEHHYPECAVRLHFWRVTGFTGTATGQLGQEIIWAWPRQLADYCFPPPSLPMVNRLRLPKVYAIIDDSVGTDLLGECRYLLEQGYRLLQARLKRMEPAAVADFLRQAKSLAETHHAWLLVNSTAPDSSHKLAHGLHLTSRDLLALEQRPSGFNWVSASCHNPIELAHAWRLGLDFAALGPVQTSQSHPDQPGIGWTAFQQMAQACPLPIYALGGMTLTDIEPALDCGGQGIAAIRGLRKTT